MRRRTIPGAIALGLLSVGCTAVTDLAGHWTHQAVHDSRERHRNAKLADAAWAEALNSNPGASADYADGFKEGFADHLYRATTQPPPLPPKRYREPRHQTPAGFRAGEDWLAGFSRGIESAQASGLREFMTGPALRTDATPAHEVVTPAIGLPPAPLPIPPIPSADPLSRRANPPRINPPRGDMKRPPAMPATPPLWPVPDTVTPAVLDVKKPALLPDVKPPVAATPPAATPPAATPPAATLGVPVSLAVPTKNALPSAVTPAPTVVLISYQSLVMRAQPHVASAAHAVFRGDPLRGSAVRVADLTRHKSETPAVSKVAPRSAQWTAAIPPARSTIEWNKRLAGSRSLPPVYGPGHREVLR